MYRKFDFKGSPQCIEFHNKHEKRKLQEASY